MSKLTDILGLFKYDPETDGANTFNITQALNNNWEKIDAWASGIKSTIIGLVPGTRKVNGKALSEDLTLTGEDIKVSGSDETSISSSLSNKAASTLGQVPESDLLAWADKQTVSGAFGINPSTTTGGVPVVGWYHGFLEVKASGRRITLTESAGQYRTWTNCTSGGEWTKWVRQATATPPEEYNLPLADGIGSSAKYSKDQFGRVQLRGWITGATANSVVATLPAGFRPASGAHFTQSISSSSQNGIARVVVRTDGTIYVELPQDGNLASGLSLQLSFLAES